MNQRVIISTFILSVMLMGCEYPNISFDSPFPKRKKNLSWKLGDQFSIQKNNDTITYRLEFNTDDRINHIINTQSNDTIFSGSVSKYKGLYFFDHKLNDTTFWISAVEIDKEIFNNTATIKGLGTVFQQMELLQKQVQKGKYRPLVKHTDSDNNVRLHPDKKLLYDFYSAVIDSFPADTIVEIIPTIKATNTIEEITRALERANTEVNIGFEEYEIIQKVYPNPAQNHIYISTYKTDQYYFELFNNSGNLIKQGQLKDKREKIDLSDIQPGLYFLRVYTEKEQTETVKIIKEK